MSVRKFMQSQRDADAVESQTAQPVQRRTSNAAREAEARSSRGTEGGTRALVQRNQGRVVDVEPEQVKSNAAQGLAGASSSLPHLDAIQASFGGGHDMSSVKANIGGNATEAASSMGASAYASGNQVAFGSTPDLHLAAHEAAHVVQQRSGVSPSGGVGAVGDSFEQNADAVADRVVQGKSATDLLPESSSAGAATPAVQHFVEDNVAGEYARASEDKKALLVGDSNFSQTLYATDGQISSANGALAASGEKGSYVKLIENGETLDYHGNALKRVAPVFQAKGDGANAGLEKANKGKDADDTMSLWADCGRSSRAVMGAHNDSAPHANYKEGATEKSTADAFNPAQYSDTIYKDVMPDFLAEAKAQEFMVDGVHYKGDKSAVISPTSAKHARKQYWELGEKGRRAFDAFAGINTGANPEVGGGYTMATEYDMPGFSSGRSAWNFHWAGVIMKAGSDNITLENYAAGGYDTVNTEWNFQMYGTVKEGQTFQDEHLGSGTHGTRASTFAVEPKKK